MEEEELLEQLAEAERLAALEEQYENEFEDNLEGFFGFDDADASDSVPATSLMQDQTQQRNADPATSSSNHLGSTNASADQVGTPAVGNKTQKAATRMAARRRALEGCILFTMGQNSTAFSRVHL